jgi:GntR family transcriptional regulator
LLGLIEQRGEGGQLPPERELSQHLQVARETLRRALGELEAEGLLQSRHGAGTFVTGPPVVKRPQLNSFSEEMRARGLVPSSRLLSAATVMAGAKLAQRLELMPGSPLLEIRRLRLASEQPMALETSYLAQARLPGLAVDDLGGGSLYQLLEERCGVQIRSAVQRLHATVLDEDEARLLGVPAFSPSLLIERTTLSSRGEPIEFAKSLYRADRYRFELSVTRDLPSDRSAT